MDGYDAATYGDRIADVYDELYPPGPGVDDAVALLADLSAGGAVLELASAPAVWRSRWPREG